jgi:hypothetical protein
MQRLAADRGAVSVIAALLMIPLIGFAAISIDVGAMWAEQQQMQTGADAGALAIAQDCGRGSCGASPGTAQTMAAANVQDGAATARVTSLTDQKVRVEVSGVRHHLFAPILGIDSSNITVDAAATWGPPSSGTGQLPLAISWCEFQAQTGGAAPSGTTPRLIAMPTEPAAGCSGPASGSVAAGFGLLATDPGSCTMTSSLGGNLRSSGDLVSNGCGPADFQKMLGRPVILPVFDLATGAGSAASYRVYGYAGFTVTGYSLGGSFVAGTACSGPDHCIQGYFTRLVDLSNSFDSGVSAPQLGASIIALTK